MRQRKSGANRDAAAAGKRSMQALRRWTLKDPAHEGPGRSTGSALDEPHVARARALGGILSA